MNKAYKMLLFNLTNNSSMQTVPDPQNHKYYVFIAR